MSVTLGPAVASSKNYAAEERRGWYRRADVKRSGTGAGKAG